MAEIWRPVAGYENEYEVSNLGRVKSLERYVVRKDGSVRHLQERIIKQNLTKKGYLTVRLHKNGKSEEGKVHRLVAVAFLENPENKPQIDHIDGNKKRNIVSNLRWVTNYENSHNKTTYGNLVRRAKTLCDYVKKPVNMFTGDTLVRTFLCISDACLFLGKDPNNSSANIWRAVNGKQKTAYGFRWEYA